MQVPSILQGESLKRLLQGEARDQDYRSFWSRDAKAKQYLHLHPQPHLPLTEGETMQVPDEGNQSPSAGMIVPCYIGEAKSDMRGIKHGWYALEDDGNLCSGPFSSREECVEKINRPAYGTTASE